jgi:hypothetical protein
MPEGGHLIAGIQTKIGFKAIAENGHGIEITGKIYDSHQQEITSFQTAHMGMGSFELTPQAAEIYTAKVKIADNITKTYPLPSVDVKGTALRVSPFNTIR